MKRPQTFPLNDANSAAQEEFVGEDANLAQRPLNVGVRVHEWGLNPLFWSYVKLFARDVHALGTLEGIDDFHVLHGKPTQRVEVSGIVVHIKQGQTKTIGGYVKYTLDDGTGLLACTHFERNLCSDTLYNGHEKRHELGDLLIVQGKLKRYRGTREVIINAMKQAADANEETLRWLQCIELAKTVYKPPFQRDEYINDELLAASKRVRQPRCECGASYAEAVGYCRCIAIPLACDPSFEFRDALLSHLAAKEECLPAREHLHFQFARDVKNNSSLRNVAIRVVSAVRAANRSRGHPAGSTAPSAGKEVVGVEGARIDSGAAAGSAGRRAEVLEHGMSNTMLNAKVLELLRAVIFSLNKDGTVHFLDKAKDIYVLVSRKRVLEPHVKAVCRERQLDLTQDDEIIRALQSTALFHHVSGSRIRTCITGLRSLQSDDFC